MPDLRDMEIGVMFWAGRDPLETVREVKSLGVRCGQLGVPGSMAGRRWQAGNPRSTPRTSRW
jgi:hypothetical protein